MLTLRLPSLLCVYIFQSRTCNNALVINGELSVSLPRCSSTGGDSSVGWTQIRLLTESFPRYHEILPLTACYVGCELSSCPRQSRFLFLPPFAEAAAAPRNCLLGAEWRTQGQLGRPAASCQPWACTLAGTPELRLIRNAGMAPSFASLSLSQDDLF